MIVNNIPQELRDRDQWGVWLRDSDGTKVPIDAKNNKAAKSNDPATWTTFERAVEVQHLYCGLAYFISPDDPFTGIDLDNCLNEQGQLRDWAVQIVARLDGVASGEVSPSGNGIKFLTKAKKPTGSRCKHKFGDDKQQLECYDNCRFWTITAEPYRGGDFTQIGDGQAAIDWVCQTHLSTVVDRVASPHVENVSHGRQSDLIKRGMAFIAKCGNSGEGGRNQAAFSLAGNLYSLEDDNGQHLNEEEVFSLVWAWNLGNSPPLDEKEVRQVVHSAKVNGTPREPKPPKTQQATCVDISAVVKGTSSTPADAAVAIASGKKELAAYKPFPLRFVPEPLRSFIRELAVAIGIDHAFIALPLLVMVAAAIGNTRRIRLKYGWNEPPILWGGIVADSGGGKSPALRASTAYLKKVQARYVKEHEEALEAYKLQHVTWQSAIDQWKRDKSVRGEPPTEPKEPQMQRLWVGDTTVEALAPILQSSPRGLVVIADELAGWLGSHNQYKKSGNDTAHWLSMFNGDELSWDRRTGSIKFVNIKSAAVSVIGGIQPGILRRSLTAEHWENGLAPRLLMVAPPKQQRYWTEDTIDERTERRVNELFSKLLDLDFQTDDEGNQRPVLVPMGFDAKPIWIDFYNRHAEEQLELEGRESSLWSKMEAYAPRFALVIHLVRCAASDPTVDTNAIDAASMEAGIGLADWFGAEARRIYAMFSESDGEKELRELVELIQSKGGAMSVRDLMRSRRRYKNSSDDAEAALNNVAKAGRGKWENQESCGAGRPGRYLVLVDTISENPEEKRIVSLSTPIEEEKESLNTSRYIDNSKNGYIETVDSSTSLSVDADTIQKTPSETAIVSTEGCQNRQCDHENPDTWVVLSGKAYCDRCDKFLHSVDEAPQ